jgi:hypothetical protein
VIESTQRRLAATNPSESILISILYFIGLVPWPEYRRKKKRGRHGIYIHHEKEKSIMDLTLKIVDIDILRNYEGKISTMVSLDLFLE